MDALVLFLYAVTPIHAGVGRGEPVDLPVQRDEFGVPCIWASSLKGALRASIEARAGDKERECVKQVFGPEPASPEVSGYSSSISLLDAKLLLVPVRSLKGVWTYATSPHLLGYLTTYYEALTGRGVGFGQLERMTLPAASRNDIVVSNGLAVLNEIEVPIRRVQEAIVDELEPLKLLPGELRDRIRRRGLVVVDDDAMMILLRRSMFVQYRVRLKRDTKAVEEGPWSEEHLPSHSVLVTGVVCRRAPNKFNELCRSNSICRWLEDKIRALNNFLWLGGKETVGRGLLKVYVQRVQGS